MLEMVISVGVLALLSVVGTTGMMSVRSRKLLDGEADTIVSVIREVQEKATKQENANNWGIKFFNTTSGDDYYTQFYGASQTSGTQKSIFYIPKTVQLLYPTSGNSSEIVVTKMTGVPSGENYIDLGSTSTSGTYRIRIDAGGKVEKIKHGYGLDAYYKFEDPANVTLALDASGHNKNALIAGATGGQTGKSGKAFLFNGTSSYVRASGFANLGTSNQAYTFAGWVKLTSGETDGNIIHMSSVSGGTGWCLPPVAVVGGKLRGYSWTGSAVTVTGTTTLAPGTWYYFTNTWDAANGLRIYVNGKLENTTAQATYAASGVSNYIFLGMDPLGCSGNAGWLAGTLDEVKVFSRSLTAEEIMDLYNENK